ncbi:MAG: tetratricopeptide repeat protein [Planctomycetes bacterium]|nr:tetratricopeptide repeat protein [Planctomycetota bacterium]
MTKKRSPRIPFAVLFLTAFAPGIGPMAESLDIERFKQLREEERYNYELCEKAYQSGNMELAINEFHKFLKLYPTIPAASYAQYMLGVSHEQHNYVNTAMKRYEELLTYYPDSPEAPKAQWAIARCYQKIGEPEKSPPEFQKVVDLYPKAPLAAQALWALSEIHLVEGKLDEAVGERKRIILEYGDHLLYSQAVDWMIAHYALTERDPVSAREMSWRVRSKEDTELHLAMLYRRHGVALYGGGEHSGGTEFVQRAIEIYRDFSVNFPKSRDRIPECEFAMAECYLDIGKHPEAVKVYQEFPQRHPWATRHFPGCVKKIIDIYKKLEKEDMVRQWYALFLNKWPSDDATRKEFGLYLEKPAGAWNEARSQYRLMQNKFDGQWEVAASFHRQKLADEAIKAYEDVINTDFARISAAYYQVGQVHQMLTHDYEKAIVAYNNSNYEAPTHMFRVAECYCAMQKWERALETCREIINFFEGSRIPAMQFMVTSVYEVRNSQTHRDRESAVSLLKAILDHYPGTGAASWAHLKLEEYGVVITGGGVAK